MKIKRFVAPDMRSAFALVRQEHGPDAVILSNRMTDEGVEIVAASNYDETLVQRTLDAMRPVAETPVVLPSFVRDAVPELGHAVNSRASSSPNTSKEPAPMSPAEAAAAYFQRNRVQTTAPAPFTVARSQPLPQAEDGAAASHTADNASPHVTSHAAFPIQIRHPGERRDPATSAMSTQNESPADTFNIATRLHPLPQAEDETPASHTADSANTHVTSQAASPIQIRHPGERPDPATSAMSPQNDSQTDAFNTTTRPHPLPHNDEQLAQMRAELAAMRGMIENEMHRLTDERLKGSPVRAQTMELMEDYGFDAGIIRDVALQIPADTELHRGRGLMLGLLSQRLPVLPRDPLEDGGVIALVGPTGAGKTTTIAKLAAAFADRHNPRDVALVTTDTVRVGGREQLHSYGRQLGIAVHEADSDVRLAQLLEKLSDYKLVLIDTAGLGQRDKNLVAQLGWLRAASQNTSSNDSRQSRVCTLLVLPANSHFADLDEVVRRFSGARPQGVVLTKVDETGRLGSALSVIVDHQLPMAWITDGQRVPEDLLRASAPNLVLRLDPLRRQADEAIPAETSHVA